MLQLHLEYSANLIYLTCIYLGCSTQIYCPHTDFLSKRVGKLKYPGGVAYLEGCGVVRRLGLGGGGDGYLYARYERDDISSMSL